MGTPVGKHTDPNRDAVITVRAMLDGEELGTITCPCVDESGDYLRSKAGNVRFAGGISRGLILPHEAHAAIRFVVETDLSTVELASPTGLHTSKKDNPTIGHHGTVEISTPAEDVRYSAKVHLTELEQNKAGDGFNLSVVATVINVPKRGAAKQSGTFSGFEIRENA